MRPWLFAVLLPGCLYGQTRAPEVSTYSLAVTTGAGSGTFDASRTAHVWADSPGAGRVFDRWTGDSDALVDALAAHTTILTSQVRAAVSVTATFKNAPVIQATQENFNGIKLNYFVPPGLLKGVLTLHHGTGGSGANWFTKIEYLIFCGDAAARGYALVALDSLDRVNKQWDATFSTGNLDVQNVLAALTNLEGRSLLPAGLPRSSLGMSNGGGFAPKMAAYGGFTAAVSYCAQAVNTGALPAPVQWRMAMNDLNDNVGSAGNERALTNFGTSLARGTPAAYERNAPAPLYPGRFQRIPGLTAADAQNLFNAIQSGGYLDAQGYFTASPSTIPAAVFPPAYLLYYPLISEEMDATYSDHQFWSDANRRTLDFLADPAAQAVAQTTRLINLSTRAPVSSGDNVLIGGFVVQGAVAKRVLLRAAGPSLAAAGVSGALADPALQLVNASGLLLASNDNWMTGGQQAEIAATPFAPADPREPAIIATLAPGAYTGIVTGSAGSTGVALIEAYDLDPAGPARLGNVSTRARVGSGDNVLIGGLVVGGTAPKRVVIRAIGPSLAAAGVSGVLTDPQLELRDAAGRLLARNDDWQAGSQPQEVLASRFVPTDPREAALVAWLAPGAYTVIVRGKNGTEGIGLVEAFELL